MTHRTTASFWEAYRSLRPDVRDVAVQSFEMIKMDPRHSSVRLKKTGSVWSARVGRGHRAVAVERSYGLLWFWIGHHDEYERLIASQ